MLATQRHPILKPWRQVIAVVATISMLAVSAAASAAATSKSTQKTFGSPDEAVAALIAAGKANDNKAFLDVLGPGAKSIVYSGDAVADRNALERFLKSYDEANKLEASGDTKAILSVGKDAWPFPIPIVKTGSQWRFDTKQGAQEILNRRIGRNELAVIQVVQAYVDAQREYYLRNPMNDKLLQYAQKFRSLKGKKDGLYYPTKDSETPSPLGKLVVTAQAEGYRADPEGKTVPYAEGYQAETEAKPVPYHGYYYRILKAQGPDAPGGAYNYVVRGKMIGGFALVAFPAIYANSGVMTFIINHEGVVYQKDLGPETAEKARNMTKFNPDKTWKRD
jgi:hypothetical protein